MQLAHQISFNRKTQVKLTQRGESGREIHYLYHVLTKGIDINGEQLNDMIFENDITLIPEIQQVMQELLTDLETEKS